MRRDFPTHLIAALSLALAVVSGQAVAQADLAPENLEFSYDETPGSLLVSFREIFGELADQGSGPLVRVFGNGQVLVSYPVFMKRGGEYERWLTPADVQSLIRSLVAKGLATFDEAAVRSQKKTELIRRRSERRVPGEPVALTYVADDSISVFQLHLESYRSPEPPGFTLRDVRRTISWYGLATDAEQFEDIEAIQRLYAAELELRALMEHEGFRRVVDRDR